MYEFIYKHGSPKNTEHTSLFCEIFSSSFNIYNAVELSPAVSDPAVLIRLSIGYLN